MHYNVVVFGVKDTSENIISYIQGSLCPVDLVITIAPSVTKKNQVSGYKGLSFLTERYGIPVFEADSYYLKDDKTRRFIEENTFDLGIVMGWQRLIPGYVLNAFRYGIFGFHGNAGYLPFGRGRSPLNWSVILGDTRFNLNLFRYDEKADSPNVFATEMFSITEHDDIRTAQYKNMICSKRLIRRLIEAFRKAKAEGGQIPIRTSSKDPDSWYAKRTPADGRIDWLERTRTIYNLIRGVAAPFPGAFCGLLSPEEKEARDSAREEENQKELGQEELEREKRHRLEQKPEERKSAVPEAEQARQEEMKREALKSAESGQPGSRALPVPDAAHPGRIPGAFGAAASCQDCRKTDAGDAEAVPGARVTIWEAHPFDEMIDFSDCAPGEVIDVFDGKPIVRTIDGSMRIDRYECSRAIGTGDFLV